MGRKSTKADKNIYQISRENAGFTREAAAERLGYISADRIEKIESEKSMPRPEEILAMADCYKNPSLCNHFCSNECPIGQVHIPEIKVKDLSQITLEVLATLSVLQQEKDRLIGITVDGEITEDEAQEFLTIQDNLEKMSNAIGSLKLWVSHTIAEGKMDGAILNQG